MAFPIPNALCYAWAVSRMTGKEKCRRAGQKNGALTLNRGKPHMTAKATPNDVNNRRNTD